MEYLIYTQKDLVKNHWQDEVHVARPVGITARQEWGRGNER